MVDKGRSTFFSIGHSNRTIVEFADLLQRSGIKLIADVRKIPKSRRNPQFGQNELSAHLAERQIQYAYLPLLGGRRGRQTAAGSSSNGYWRVKSFRHYADYTLTADFAEGIAELRSLGRASPTAIMCAEAVWWKCHRRLIVDRLLVEGDEVFHILGAGNVQPAALNPGAVVGPDGALVYPEPVEPCAEHQTSCCGRRIR